jgi:hypothetical protein
MEQDVIVADQDGSSSRSEEDFYYEQDQDGRELINLQTTLKPNPLPTTNAAATGILKQETRS